MPFLFQARYVCDMCAICAWYVRVMCAICVRQKAMFQLIKNDFWGKCFFFLVFRVQFVRQIYN